MFRVRSGDHVIKLNGLDAWFRVSGSGPTCLFPTPGWGASSDLYFETMAPLERLFQIVYLDTRGSGRSQRELSNEEYRLERFLSDLEQLRQYIGESRVWVMGHSLGGLLAQVYAIAYPSSCCGLILLDSVAAMDDNFRADHDLRVNRRRDEPWFAEANATYQGTEDIATDDQFKEFFRRILPFYFHDVSKLTAAANSLNALTFSAEAYSMMSVNSAEFGRGVLQRLDEIRVPTVIVVGDDDFICSPVQAARIHLRIHGSKLVVIEEAGHFPWFEQPDSFYREVEDALRYLGAVTVSG